MKYFITIISTVIATLICVPIAQADTAWDTKINGKGRFELLRGFNNEAVLDNETNLVWQRTPFAIDVANFRSAHMVCWDRVTTGGRIGWRLPSVEELSTLVDINKTDPSLPNGHPFQGVQSGSYWTATTRPDFLTLGLRVSFLDGSVDSESKQTSLNIWCVRSPGGVDGNTSG